MTKRLGCVVVLVVAACGGSPASSPPPSTAATVKAPPAAPHPLRKWGYPTSAECTAALQHMLTIVQGNAELAPKIAGQESVFVTEGSKECRDKWLLGQLDCVTSTTAFAALDTCMSADYAVPEGTDVSTAPNRATPAQCSAAVEHLAAIDPSAYDDMTKKLQRGACLASWRPHMLACTTSATTADAAAACGTN